MKLPAGMRRMGWTVTPPPAPSPAVMVTEPDMSAPPGAAEADEQHRYHFAFPKNICEATLKGIDRYLPCLRQSA